MAKQDIENAKLALKHRLYSQPTYRLIEELRGIGLYEAPGRCILHYEDGVPVGCAIRVNGQIQVFVRKSKRNRGIGRSLVKRLKVRGCWGSKSSISQGRIFDLNGIKTFY